MVCHIRERRDQRGGERFLERVASVVVITASVLRNLGLALRQDVKQKRLLARMVSCNIG